MIMDQVSKLAVNLIIVALTAVAAVAPASGAVFFSRTTREYRFPPPAPRHPTLLKII